MVDQNRIKMIFYLLSTKDGYISSASLAKELNVSERTIKNDIKELKYSIDDYGARLISKKAYGYRLEPIDKEKYKTAKEQLYLFAMSTGISNGALNSRAHKILQDILISEKYLTLDDLASDNYITKSSLRDDIKEIKTILKSYNLTIKNKNETGSMVCGREYDKRQLMTESIENFHHWSLYANEEIIYNKWFKCDKNERLEMRQIMIKTLRKYGCHVKDMVTIKMSRYLCLIRNRYEAGYKLNFSNKEKEAIKNLKEYEMVKQMFKQLEKYGLFASDEEEVLSCTLYLSSQIDYQTNINFKNLYPQRYEEGLKIIDLFLKKVKHNYNIDLSSEQDFKTALMSIIIPLIIKIEFKTAEYIRFFGSVTLSGRNNSLCQMLAYEFRNTIKDLYNLNIGDEIIFDIANCLENAILNINYSARPLRILVVTEYGMNVNESICKIINYRLGKFIEKIEPYELYELRDLKYEDWDFVISSVSEYMYSYKWPIYVIEHLPNNKNIDDIYNRFFISHNVNIDVLLNKLKYKRINYFNNFELCKINDFYKLLVYKTIKNSDNFEKVYKGLLSKDLYINNGICTINLNYKDVKEPIFEIYLLKKETIINKTSINTIIVLSLDFENSLELVRLFHDFFLSVEIFPDKIYECIDNGDQGIIEKVVKQSLKMLPISF